MTKQNFHSTMHLDLEAARGYDPGYDADAGSARLASSLAGAAGATALCGLLPKAASAGGWAALKASAWGPVALAIALGTGGAVTTVVVGISPDSVVRRTSVAHPVRLVTRPAKLEVDVAQGASFGLSENAALEPAIEAAPSSKAPPPRHSTLPLPQANRDNRSIRGEVHEVATLRNLLATHPAQVLDGIDGRQASGGVILDEERAILAIEALVALDRSAEAGERARVFIAAYPSSAYAMRARALMRQ